MDIATQVQTLDNTVCISQSADTLGKGMNSIIHPPNQARENSRANWALQLWYSNQSRRRKTECSPVKLLLKLALCRFLLVQRGWYTSVCNIYIIHTLVLVSLVMRENILFSGRKHKIDSFVHIRTFNYVYLYTHKSDIKKIYTNLEHYKYYSMNKQYVEGVRNSKRLICQGR